MGDSLDEDTAAFIGPDNTLEVEAAAPSHRGRCLTQLQFSSLDRIDDGEPVCLLGLNIHILVRGATFNLHTTRQCR